MRLQYASTSPFAAFLVVWCTGSNCVHAGCRHRNMHAMRRVRARVVSPRRTGPGSEPLWRPCARRAWGPAGLLLRCGVVWRGLWLRGHEKKKPLLAHDSIPGHVTSRTLVAGRTTTKAAAAASCVCASRAPILRCRGSCRTLLAYVVLRHCVLPGAWAMQALWFVALLLLSCWLVSPVVPAGLALANVEVDLSVVAPGILITGPRLQCKA